MPNEENKLPDFSGAAKLAQRRAWRKGLPVVIMEDGEILYYYKDGRKEKVELVKPRPKPATF